MNSSGKAIPLAELVREQTDLGRLKIVFLPSHVFGGLAFLIYTSRPSVGFLVPTMIYEGAVNDQTVLAGLSFPQKDGKKSPPILFANISPLFSNSDPGSAYSLDEIIRCCQENGLVIVCAGHLSYRGDTTLHRSGITFYDGHEFRLFYSRSVPDDPIVTPERQIIIPLPQAA